MLWRLKYQVSGIRFIFFLLVRHQKGAFAFVLFLRFLFSGFKSYILCTYLIQQYLVRVHRVVYINILIDIFLLKVLGWCTPGISGVPLGHRLRAVFAERSSFSLVSCSALLFCVCSFCKLFLDVSGASCKFGFPANTILTFFAIFSYFCVVS